MARKRRQKGRGIFRGSKRQRGRKQKGGTIFKPSTYEWLRQGGFGFPDRKIKPKGKQKGGAIGMGAMLALSMAPMLLNKII